MNNTLLRDPLLAFLTEEDLNEEFLNCSSCLSDPALPSRSEAFNMIIFEKIFRTLNSAGYGPESVSFVAGEENFCLDSNGNVAPWCDGHYSSHMAMCHSGELDLNTLKEVNALSIQTVDAGLPQTCMISGTLEYYIFQDNDV